ncbi:MAG: RNA polymerase sigma factor [Marinoscillum sp.]
MDRLIKKIAQGNRRAQSQFYDEFSSLVMGVCLRYTKDSNLADDVFQEAFIKIFQNIDTVKDLSAIHGWVKRITINTALDHLNALRFTDSIDTEGHELSDQFYSELLDKLSNEVVLDAINRLPEGYRIVFNMNVIDGFSHKEIARDLGVTESTSRSQLVHAKRLLKKYLNELGITRYEQVI